MRLIHALATAAAYSLGRPAARLAPIDPATPVIIQAGIEPWRPAAMSDEPDPIAEFVGNALRTAAGARTSMVAVLAAYARWAEGEGRRAADPEPVLARLRRYTSVIDVPGRGLCVVGMELQPWAARAAGNCAGLSLKETAPTLRAIPGLRARVLADSALLAAELLAVIQSTRAVLEVATDEESIAGDAVRLAAGMLDDAIADAAAPAP